MIVKVDYDEFEPRSYRGVYVEKGEEVLYKSDEGDFVKDYNNVSHWIRENAGQEKVMMASSFNHYIIDKK